MFNSSDSPFAFMREIRPDQIMRRMWAGFILALVGVAAILGGLSFLAYRIFLHLRWVP